MFLQSGFYIFVYFFTVSKWYSVVNFSKVYLRCCPWLMGAMLISHYTGTDFPWYTTQQNMIQ
jgi:hypothetical protein